MNSNIEKGKKEYDSENYKEALKYFNKVSERDKNYSLMVVYKINSLMKLEEYEKCLKLLNSLIEKSPYDELYWYEKVRCHILLKQDDKALKALGEFERIVDNDDKYFMLSISKFYDFLGDSKKALEFCQKAIDLDGNYEEAYFQKAQLVSCLDDYDSMVECGEKLIEFADGNMLKLMMPFLLNLFSKNFKRCYEIIQLMDGADEEINLMLKTVIYNEMVEELGIEIRSSAPCEWDVDDALVLFFKYQNEGIKMGIHEGVNYLIV